MSKNSKSLKVFVIFKENAFKHPYAKIAYTPLLEALETIGIAYETVSERMLLQKSSQIKSDDLVLFVDCYLFEYTSEEAKNIFRNINATKVSINFDDEYMLGWTLKITQHMHAVITFDTVTYEFIRQLGIQVYLCPHPLSEHKIANHTQKKYEYDVSFIGRVSSDKPERYNLLTKIKETFPNAYIPGLRGDFISTAEMQTVFNSSKININLAGISSFKMDLSLPYQSHRLGFKGRPFEIGLCQGFCLSEPSPVLQRMLVETESIGYFSGVDECLSKIQYYLDNPKIREGKARLLYDFSKTYVSSNSKLNLFSNVIIKIINNREKYLFKKTMFESYSAGYLEDPILTSLELERLKSFTRHREIKKFFSQIFHLMRLDALKATHIQIQFIVILVRNVFRLLRNK